MIIFQPPLDKKHFPLSMLLSTYIISPLSLLTHILSAGIFCVKIKCHGINNEVKCNKFRVVLCVMKSPPPFHPSCKWVSLLELPPQEHHQTAFVWNAYWNHARRQCRRTDGRTYLVGYDTSFAHIKFHPQRTLITGYWGAATCLKKGRIMAGSLNWFRYVFVSLASLTSMCSEKDCGLKSLLFDAELTNVRLAETDLYSDTWRHI